MLATPNGTDVSVHFPLRFNQPIFQSLVIAFSMITAQVRADASAQHALAKERRPLTRSESRREFRGEFGAVWKILGSLLLSQSQERVF
jgi:hypothetical protein